MPKANLTHPTREQLAEFESGRMAEPEAVGIEAHVAECPACVTTLDALPRDTLVSLLKKPAPTGTWSTKAGSAPENFPEQFGHYRIIKELGRGGMGSVFLAHDTQLDRDVALKVPRGLSAEDSGLLERFYREARAAANLHHPNLCQVFEVNQVNGMHYLTMPYIPGQPLSSRLKAKGPLPQREAAKIVRQSALAMHEAHAKGVIHRDLKPANIMMNERGEPVIMDFGLARRELRSEDRLTQTGDVMGTPAYMPPEQVRGDQAAIGPCTDIYSLGVVLYELLTGRLPFQGTYGQQFEQVLTREPPPPSKFRLDLDPALESVCLQAMQKRPGDRFATMKAFADALTNYLKATLSGTAVSATGHAATVFGQLSKADERAFQRAGVKPSFFGRTPILGLIAAAAAGVILLGGVVLYYVTDNGTIKIELSDEKAQVEVKVDGGTVSITGLEEPLKLKVGKHELEVTGRNFRTLTKSFTVKRGDNEPLRVTLVEKEPTKEVIKPKKPELGEQKKVADEPAKLKDRITEVRRFDGHQGLVMGVAFSPDGKRALSASNDKTMRLWNVETGQAIRVLAGHGDTVASIQFFADGRRALSGSADKTVRIWDLETGGEIRKFEGHADRVLSVALSPDEKLALSGSVDKTMRLWNIEDGQETHRFDGHEQGVHSVCFSPDGRKAASAGFGDCTIRVWDVEKRQQLHVLRGKLGPRGMSRNTLCVAFCPDNRHLFSGSYDQILTLWDVETGQEVRWFSGHKSFIWCVAISADGTRAISGASGRTENDTVRLWDVKTGAEIGSFDGQPAWVRGVAFSPDGQYALSSGDDYTIRLLRLPEPPAERAATKPALTWPADALTEGRIKAPDLSKAQVLHTDEFDNPKSGHWTTGYSGVTRDYADGKFLIRRSTSGSGWTKGPWTVRDCAVLCVGRIVGSKRNSWAIELTDHARRRGVGIHIKGDGKVSLGPTYTQVVGRYTEFFPDDISHPAVKTGDEFNTLLVVVRGRTLEVYVNGVAVCEPLTTDFDFLPGTLDLYAGMQQPSGTAEFERIVVYSAEGLPTLKERLAKGELGAMPKPFTWPADALKEGRIKAPDLSKAQVLFTDEFDNPSSGFSIRKDRQRSADSGYENGKYFIRDLFSTSSGRAAPWKVPECVCEVAGRVRGDSTGSWGVAITDATSSEGLHIMLSAEGRLQVSPCSSAAADAGWPKVGPLAHRSIKTGDDFNVLRLALRASQLEVFVNGVAVCDPVTLKKDLAPFTLALWLKSPHRTAEAEFDRITVYSVEGVPTPEERVRRGEVPDK